MQIQGLKNLVSHSNNYAADCLIISEEHPQKKEEKRTISFSGKTIRP